MRRANNTSVALKDIEVWATGMFRCEVLADAPSFHTVTAEAYMIVGDMYNGDFHYQSCPYVLIASLLVTIFKIK
ncbi:hypothetical protein AVEN_102840-1 [Araneus ventricosus]|uniref:Ig-like domain-containing protein n=1 Tax=Araneus ventricosus TaxID=182803 RepID=A0A4Y2PDG3_ARAVE|nr:hypothetical protein AVEN_102840-1 [Araneus ventricosus]